MTMKEKQWNQKHESKVLTGSVKRERDGVIDGVCLQLTMKSSLVGPSCCEMFLMTFISRQSFIFRALFISIFNPFPSTGKKIQIYSQNPGRERGGNWKTLTRPRRTFTHELCVPLVCSQVDADGDDLIVKLLLTLLVEHLHELPNNTHSMWLTGSLTEANGAGCFSAISYLRYAVSVHKHALEAVVNADVIQNRDDDLAIALHTLGGGGKQQQFRFDWIFLVEQNKQSLRNKTIGKCSRIHDVVWIGVKWILLDELPTVNISSKC